MTPRLDLERSFRTGGLGIGQTITAAAAARRNNAVLPIGRYLIKILTGALYLRGPVAAGSVAVATDMRLDVGELAFIDITENEQFISVLEVAAGATAAICGTDDTTRPADLTAIAWA